MTFKHILLATDFSAAAKPAYDLAVSLAHSSGAGLTLVHSWDIPSYSYGVEWYGEKGLAQTLEDSARACLTRDLAALQTRFPTAKAVLRAGDPSHEILAAAAELDADLVVLGTHGRRGFSRMFLGSVAERVVRLASMPVLTVHDLAHAQVA